ncbi:MAG: hypothetical protein IJ083_14745 [Clostridia bacterium]|nr:hypothetical protein [Clostridia bacterium]
MLTPLQAENIRYSCPFGLVPLPSPGPVRLQASLTGGHVTFSFATDGDSHDLDKSLDASFLSDEACQEGWFTGARGRLCCLDLTGGRVHTDFSYFRMVV